MFNTFPQPKPDSGGGLQSPLDWSAYQTVYDFTGTATSIPASTWQTFVDVTGKGFFKWCRASSSTTTSPNPDIRLTIDGQVYLFAGVSSGGAFQGNEIKLEIPFKTSLKIEAFNGSASSASPIICDYLYLLQQLNPSPSKVTILQQSQRKMAYLNGTSTTLADVLNIAGSGYLLSANFLGYYSTAVSAISGDVAVDGAQRMTNRALFTIDSSGYKQSEIVGPIRFDTSLRIKIRTGNAGTPYLCIALYSLD